MDVNPRRLLLYYALTFAILLVAEVIGYGLTEYGLLDLGNLINSLKSLTFSVSLSTIILIFSHNAIINFAINIPFIGLLAYIFSIGETGLLLGYAAASINIYSRMGILAIPLTYALTALMPHGWLELMAYSISIYNSMDLSSAITRHEPISLRRWIILLIISMIVLLVAAAVETGELMIIREIGL
ncbi:MAG: stage II sporulation protein M [Thermocladium sp.]